MNEFERQSALLEMGADYGDPDQNYCDNCWREISGYQSTVGEGFCSECATINEEAEAL